MVGWGQGRRRAFIGNALEQADVELDLVPHHLHAWNLSERQADVCLPLLWTVEDEIVELITQHRVLAEEGIRAAQATITMLLRNK
jgi:hypothetical protein